MPFYPPLLMALMAISRSRFKQPRNSLHISLIFVMACFVNFGYVWEGIIFLKGFEKFREIRNF